MPHANVHIIMVKVVTHTDKVLMAFLRNHLAELHETWCAGSR